MWHLAADERERLERITRTGKGAAWRIQRAHALLKCDRGPEGPGWTDERIAEAFGISVRSVEHWRQQAVAAGPESLLEREARATPPIPPKLDGAGEAQLVKLACSQPPEGRANWTLRLLAAAPGQPARIDFIAVRKGVSSVWMFVEPLAGWRKVEVTRAAHRGRLGHASARPRRASALCRGRDHHLGL